MKVHGDEIVPTEAEREAEAAAAAADVAEVEEQAAAADALVDAQVELAKWKELALRTAADLDNFRKRMAREREEALKYACQGLLEELLPVLDNFEMGMQAAAKEQGSMIYIGMDMVRRQFADLLGAQGVEEVPVAAGAEFDPTLHEAMSQQESTEVADGHVLRVVRRGFRLRERLLRPASVIVAKAPASEPAPS